MPKRRRKGFVRIHVTKIWLPYYACRICCSKPDASSPVSICLSVCPTYSSSQTAADAMWSVYFLAQALWGPNRPVCLVWQLLIWNTVGLYLQDSFPVRRGTTWSSHRCITSIWLWRRAAEIRSRASSVDWPTGPMARGGHLSKLTDSDCAARRSLSSADLQHTHTILRQDSCTRTLPGSSVIIGFSAPCICIWCLAPVCHEMASVTLVYYDYREGYAAFAYSWIVQRPGSPHTKVHSDIPSSNGIVSVLQLDNRWFICGLRMTLFWGRLAVTKIHRDLRVLLVKSICQWLLAPHVYANVELCFWLFYFGLITSIIATKKFVIDRI